MGIGPGQVSRGLVPLPGDRRLGGSQGSGGSQDVECAALKTRIQQLRFQSSGVQLLSLTWPDSYLKTPPLLYRPPQYRTKGKGGNENFLVTFLWLRKLRYFSPMTL